MSLLPYATLYGPGQPIYIPVGTQVSSFGISSLNANTITTDRLITSEAIFSTIIGSNIATENLTASFIQVLDTLNSYFTNTEYATVNCNLTVSNDAQLNQVFANYLNTTGLDVLQSYISSIITTSINLDDNLLDTAGAGVGAVLLLNGIPIATTSTSISSLTEWSYYPALSSVNMDNFSLCNVSSIYAQELSVLDMISSGNINSRYINVQCNINVGNESILNQVAANYIGTQSFDCQTDAFISSLEANNIIVTNLNTSNIITSSITAYYLNSFRAEFQSSIISSIEAKNITATNLNASNITANNLNASNIISMNFSNASNIITDNITVFCNVNSFSADITELTSQNSAIVNGSVISLNATNANVSGTLTIDEVRGTNGFMNLEAANRIRIRVKDSSNVFESPELNLEAGGGNRGKIIVIAKPGFGGVQGEVSIEARGGSAAGYATGGLLELKATSGTSVFGTLNTSRVAIAGDSITSYAGPIQPFVGLLGYNFVQGTLGVNIVAGAAAALPNVPGTVYLYGLNPLGFGSSGGVRVQNGMSIDYITPYPQGFIAPEYDLFIRGNPAGQMVTLCNVRYLFGCNAEATGFNNMNAVNLNGTNLNATNIYGTNIAASNLNTSSGTISSFTALNAQVQQIYNVSTINGFTINQLISSVTPPQIVSTISTFSELYTSSLFANSISTNQLQAYYITGVSTLNGFTIAELVSSVSPPTPAPSTFAQLFTSSLVANNVSTLTLQAGQILLNGVPLSPPGPQISTFNQLFASTLFTDSISTGTLSFSSLNGYNISSIVNQPVVSTFFELFVSSGTINNLSNIALTVSSINGFNTNDFLSTSGFIQQSSFNQFFTNTLSTGVITVSSINGFNTGQFLNTSSFNQFFTNTLSTGVITLSSINGFNTGQFLNQPLLSTFPQFYVSDLNTNNFSSFTGNVAVLTGVSTINGFTIAQFISTTTPAPPQLSTFTQLFASSIGASAGTLNIGASNINLAATCNIILNSSNAVSIYTTLTPPTLPTDGIIILGQGTTTLASQSNTNITAANNILLNAVQITQIIGGDYVNINTNLGLQLTASNNIVAAASTINLNGNLFVNGAAYGQLVSSYQQLFASSINGAAFPQVIPSTIISTYQQLFTSSFVVNTINGAAYPPPAPSTQQLSTFDTIFTNNIRTLSNTIKTQAIELLFSSSQEVINTNEILVNSKSVIDLFAADGIGISSPLITLFGNTTTFSLTVPAISNVSSINGAVYPPPGTQSTFSEIFTTTLASQQITTSSIIGQPGNNLRIVHPFIQIDSSIEADLYASQQIEIATEFSNITLHPGYAVNGAQLIVRGTTNLCNFDMIGVSSINGAVYPPTSQQISTFNQLNFSTLFGLGDFPCIFFSTGQDFFIGSSDNPLGNSISFATSELQIDSENDLFLFGRGYVFMSAGGVGGSYIDIESLASINLNTTTTNISSNLIVGGNIDVCNNSIANLASISTTATNLTINTAADFDINCLGGFHVDVTNDIDISGNNNIIMTGVGRFDLTSGGTMNLSNQDYTLTTTSSITISNGTQTDVRTAEYNLYTEYFNRNLSTNLVRQPIIQIGKGIGGPANAGYVNITLPVDYGNTSYNVSVLATPNGVDIPSTYIPIFCADVISGNSMDIYWRESSASEQTYFDWETFGYYGTDTGTGTGTDTGSGTGTPEM